MPQINIILHLVTLADTWPTSFVNLSFCCCWVYYYTISNNLTLDEKCCFRKLETLRKPAWNLIIKFQVGFRTAETPFRFQWGFSQLKLGFPHKIQVSAIALTFCRFQLSWNLLKPFKTKKVVSAIWQPCWNLPETSLSRFRIQSTETWVFSSFNKS